MYRFTPVLIAVCIVAIATFSVQAESDENEAAAETSHTPGWFRVDTDSLGTHFLIGATHSVGGLALESNIFIDDTIGEFDLGVSIPAVQGEGLNVILLPMLGLGYDFRCARWSPRNLSAPLCFYAGWKTLLEIVDNRHPLFRVRRGQKQ